jgi:hypothetical protein
MTSLACSLARSLARSRAHAHSLPRVCVCALARVCVCVTVCVCLCVLLMRLTRALLRPEDHREFLGQVIGPLPAQRRKKFEAGWPLHRGFGACCDPAIFHLEGVWSIRQDPDLYKIASHISGETRLWVDINRSIQKLPGQGDNEFLHFDFSPFAAVRLSDMDPSAPRGLCGKICYTQSRFVCVPGTHSRAFLEDFVSKYAQHYPNVKPSDKKFGLVKDKPDPLNLVARKRCLVIPRGCLVFWHSRLLHGQMKTPLSDPVEYGSYIGMFPAGARPQYREVCGVDELDDRLGSFLEGRAPILWPRYADNCKHVINRNNNNNKGVACDGFRNPNDYFDYY